MKPIFVGLDTDEQGRICTVMLSGDRPWTHAKMVRYLDIQQFQEAWKGEFDGWKFDFAVALDHFEFVRRPSKVADWLTTRREVFIDHFNFPGLYPYFENDVREVPDTFHKAYVLAMCAYYRGHAQQTARDLILEVYSLQRRLQKLEEGLNRMAYTTPPARSEPYGIYCPF